MLKTFLIFLAVAIGSVFAFYVFPVQESDYALYDELVKSSRPEETSLITYSQQCRDEVSKHIWYNEDNPLYFRIDSDESNLFFFHQGREVEVIEQLGHVRCLMQEELFYLDEKPMQHIRYLEAASASFNYNTHLFIAQDVEMWKYQQEGHEAPETFFEENVLMRATADSVEFTLQGKKLDFTAHQMKALFTSKEGKIL